MNTSQLRFFVLVICIATCAVSAFSQPKIQWDKTFGGNAGDMLQVVAQAPDGGYILGGHSQSGISGEKTEATVDQDLWIVKTAADGSMEWSKTLTMQNAIIELKSLLVTNDGGYVVAGSTAYSTWIVKLDQAGIVEWDKVIDNGVGRQIYGSMQQTADGGYIVGRSWGIMVDPNLGEESLVYYDYQVIKLSADGSIQWEKLIGGSGSDFLESIQQTSDGGYFLAGSTLSGIGGDKSEASRGSSDYWIVKLDRDGVKQWDKTIGGSGYDELLTTSQTLDGGYILAGSSRSLASGEKTESAIGKDFWVVKLLTTGQIEWDNSIAAEDSNESTIYDMLSTLIPTSDGGYLMGIISGAGVGRDKSEIGKGEFDYWIVKLGEDGTKLWDKIYGTSKAEFFSSIAETSDGGYLLGGSSHGGIDGDKTDISRGNIDYWIIKLGPEGSLPVTLANFKAQKENTVTNLTWQTTSETRSDRFEVEHSKTGKSWAQITMIKTKGESSDLVTYQYTHLTPSHGENLYRLKMIDLDGTFSYSKIERVKIDLGFSVTVYPNPAAETIHILAADWSKVKSVEVLNSLGKSIYQSGKKPVQSIDARSLPAGLYFVKVGTTDRSEAMQKLVIGQ